MSDRDGVGIDGDMGDLEVARALARAIREAGRALASEPRRVQGMVNDLLGIESRTRRAEIDAVVLAAEESIPEDLLAGRIDLETAQARLHDRGLDEGVALFAVQVWQFALGMLASDAQPPSLRNSLDGSSRTVPADPAATFPAPGPKAVPDASSTASGTGDERPKKPIRRLILAGTAVVLVLCLVLLGAAVWLARDNGGTDAAPASTDAPASTVRTTTTTTTATSSTPPPVIMQVGFDVEATPLGELTRTWTVEDGELVATLVFENRTDTPTSGRYLEAVPKSLAATASLITSEPPHDVILDDPVIAWNLMVEPGGVEEVTYVVALSADVTSESLEAMRAEQLADAEALRVELGAGPRLAFATSDQTVTTGSLTLNGTIDPRATLTILGNPIDVNPDGTWLTTSSLEAGLNTLTFVATSRLGTVVSKDVLITFAEPPPSTSPPTTSRPGTTTTTPRPSTTTQPPPPPPPSTTEPAPAGP